LQAPLRKNEGKGINRRLIYATTKSGDFAEQGKLANEEKQPEEKFRKMLFSMGFTHR
jgi:hypothetical protein